MVLTIDSIISCRNPNLKRNSFTKMSGYTDHSHDEPLFREEQRAQEYSPYPNLNNNNNATTTPTAAAGGHMFGAPPMGDPAEPSSHPDNITAASTPNVAASSPTSFGSNRTMSLGRSPNDKPTGPATGMGMGGGGLRRQPSGAYDAATGTSKTDKGLFSGSQQSTPIVNQFNQSPSQPGVAGTVPVGHQPGSPYVQTQDVPAAGKSKFSVAFRVIVLFVFWVGVGICDVEIWGIIMFVCVVLSFEASSLCAKWMITFAFWV